MLEPCIIMSLVVDKWLQTNSSIIVLKKWAKFAYRKNHIPHEALDSDGKDVRLDQELCQDEGENLHKAHRFVENHHRKFLTLQNSSKTHTD